MKVGLSVEIDSCGFYQETVSGGVQEENVETIPMDIFEFGEARISVNDKVASWVA